MLTKEEKQNLETVIKSSSLLEAAKWLINKNLKQILRTPVAVEINDLPDTAILADGISEIELCLENDEFQNADDIAYDTASNILYDLGYDF